MSTSIVRGGDTRIADQAIDDVVRQVIIPIWNAYKFFTLYANVENHRASFRTDSTELLDRYLLAKTRDLVADVERRMDAYDLPGAAMENSKPEHAQLLQPTSDSDHLITFHVNH